MKEVLEGRLKAGEEALAGVSTADDAKRLRNQLWDSITMSGDVTMIEGAFVSRDLWLAFAPRFRALTERIEAKLHGPGRSSWSREVIVIGKDGKPRSRRALTALDGLVPLARPPMLFDALPEARIALSYDVFGARLWVDVSFAGQGVDTAAQQAELEGAWKRLRWDLPPEVRRLELGEEERETFVPGAVLARAAPKVVGIAKVVLPAKVLRNGKKLSPKQMQLVDGTPDASGEDLVELPNFQELEGLVRGWARLELAPRQQAITATFTFEVSRLPGPRQSKALLEAATQALYSSWGMNLDWDLPPLDDDADYTVEVGDPSGVEVTAFKAGTKTAAKKPPAKKSTAKKSPAKKPTARKKTRKKASSKR